MNIFVIFPGRDSLRARCGGLFGGAGGPSGAKGAGRLNRPRRSAHCFFDQVQLLAKDGLAPEEPGDVLERAQRSAEPGARPMIAPYLLA
jgi:hypothetical protein